MYEKLENVECRELHLVSYVLSNAELNIHATYENDARDQLYTTTYSDLRVSALDEICIQMYMNFLGGYYNSGGTKIREIR